MKQKLLTKLLTLVLLTLGGVINPAWAQSDYSSDYTGNITLSTTGGTSASDVSVKINNITYENAIKAGTSKIAGAVKITVPSGTKYLHLHVAGWNGESVTLKVTPSGYSSNISLTSDSSISGGGTTFSLSNSACSTSYYKVITFSDPLESNTDLTFTASGGKRFVIWGVTAEKDAPAYAISAQSNNNEYGTVSLVDYVITGSPESGYRYASPAYTVSPANSATVEQDGNEFTVTPLDNTTVTINFEAIPTHTLSSSVSPVDAGTVTLGATSIMEGSTTTATASANAGYKFTGWSIFGTDATLSSTTDNPTTITMGSTDAIVTATFEAATTYEIKWSVNGTIVKTENVEENAAISFDDPTSGVPTGYTFKGWVTASNRIDGTTDTDPSANYVTSANSTEDITYYAVLAVGTPGTATWTLDYSKESSLSASTSWGAYGDAYEYTASDGGIWTVKAYKNSGMQINTGKNSSIKVPSCAGNIQSISITCSAAKAVGFSSGDYSGSGTITYLATGTDATSQTLDLSSNSAKVGYIVPKSGSTSITKIVVTYANTTYSHFCTAVSDVPAIVTADSYATFASELPLDFSSSSIKAYIAEVKGDKSGVTFTQVNKVPANTGVLLYKDGGESEYIPVLTTTVDDVTGNVFVKGTGATVATDDGDNYNYILNKVGDVVGFYRAAGKKVAANRAYISIPKAAPIKEFIALPDFEDDATSIEETLSDSPLKGENIYNLAGQRIQKLQKGINIVNGKKVLF